jgi:hypothetical protein
MNSTWNIPVFLYDLNTQQERVYWLLRDGGICPPNNSNFKKNLIFNHQAKGFYRVNYSTDLLGEILQTNLSQLDELTQLGLVQDAIALDNPLARDLLYKLMKDSNGLVSSELATYVFDFFDKMEAGFEESNEKDLFQVFIERLMRRCLFSEVLSETCWNTVSAC